MLWEYLQRHQTGRHCWAINPSFWQNGFDDLNIHLARFHYFLFCNQIGLQIQNLPSKNKNLHKWRPRLHRAHRILLTSDKAVMLGTYKQVLTVASMNALLSTTSSQYLQIIKSTYSSELKGFLCGHSLTILLKIPGRCAWQSLLRGTCEILFITFVHHECLVRLSRRPS